MNIISRRIAAGIALAAAPALIALGAAATSSAQTTATPTVPTVTSTSPTVGHQAFPGQQNFPQPGSTIHHHHQAHR